MKKIVVISSYPPKGVTHSKKLVGIASYTKNTLVSLSGRFKFIVLAEKLEEEKNYSDGNITVYRVWKRNSPFVFPILIKCIFLNKNSDEILFEFEHAMFGGVFSLILLPVFLIVARLSGKKVFFVFHQVIYDIRDIQNHIGIKTNVISAFVINLFINLYYLIILSVVTKAVVFEKEMKNRLTMFGFSNKVEVIPHGIEIFKNSLETQEARKRLNLMDNKFIVLHFGFLAWYKGTDLILKNYASLSKDKKNKISLILAGGPNPNHVGKKYYDKYINSIEKEAKKNGVLLTGFIPEEEISLYFDAADVVIFPYRVFLSASGPMSIALSHKKSILISQELAPLTETEDFKKAMIASGISKKDIIFKSKDFTQNLEIDHNIRERIEKFSSILSKERSFAKIASMYEKLF